MVEMFTERMYRCLVMSRMFHGKIGYIGHSYDGTRLHKPICSGLYLEQFNDSDTSQHATKPGLVDEILWQLCRCFP